MWLVAVGKLGRVVLLSPEQIGLPFAEMQRVAGSDLGPIFSGASATLEGAEFLARLSWARWIVSDAPAAVEARNHLVSLASVNPNDLDLPDVGPRR